MQNAVKRVNCVNEVNSRIYMQKLKEEHIGFLLSVDFDC